MSSRSRQMPFGRRQGHITAPSYGKAPARARFGYVFFSGLLAGAVLAGLIGLGFASASSLSASQTPSGITSNSKQAFWQASPRVTEARGWVVRDEARAVMAVQALETEL